MSAHVPVTTRADLMISDVVAARLEELFAAEMEGRFTKVSPRRVAIGLINDGLIEPRTFTKRDRFGEYSFEVHRLTIRGHMLFCEWASRQPGIEPP